jgi:hypothetical protein
VVNDAGLAGPFARAAVSLSRVGVTPANHEVHRVGSGDLRSFLLTGLTVGTPYQVRVQASSPHGISTVAVAAPAYLSPKMAPNVPFNATLIVVSESRLKLIWMAPQFTGGAPVEKYIVQWDATKTFSNVLARGYQMTLMTATLGSGPSYCTDIVLDSVLQGVPVFARISADNGFMASDIASGLPTPPQVTSEIRSAGAPLSVRAEATSGGGLSLFWQPPSNDACYFGGDGGSAITNYVVEWDTRIDFGSPAKSAVVGAEATSIEIGGRNFTTGEPSSEITGGEAYFVRVTAFNARGAGISGFISTPELARDKPPSAPVSADVVIDDSTGLTVSWVPPDKDGGVTLEKYRLSYSTDKDFSSREVVDFPIVSEVQTVAASSNVQIETQAIRIMTEVTNERQLIRSQVEGVDEIQTITTHCNDVVNEVQTITTSAVDVNEVQTIELDGSEVHERQTVRTEIDPTDVFSEIQVVDVYANEIYEVQRLGAIFDFSSYFDTSICADWSAGLACANAKTLVGAMTFKLFWDADDCGLDSLNDNQNSNFCVIEATAGGLTYGCSSECESDDLTFNTDALTLQSALEGQMEFDSSGGAFWGSSLGPSVTVTAETFGTSSTDYKFVVYFEFTFDGQYVRGNVPPVQVSDVDASSLAAGITYSNLGQASDGQLQVSTSHATFDTSAEAFTVKEGNQPEGEFKLTYFCEARTEDLTASVSNFNELTITASPNAIDLNDYLYMHVRLVNSYYQIVSVDSVNNQKATFFPDYSTQSTLQDVSGEVGIFFSDPQKANGVSDSCLSLRSYETGVISKSANDEAIKIAIRGLTSVIQITDPFSILVRDPVSGDAVTRHAHGSGKIGYVWTVEFVRQHGNPAQMTCNDDALSPMSSDNAATVSCDVSTYQEGTLIDGTFTLRQNYPHKYLVGTGGQSVHTSPSFVFNIDADHMAQELSQMAAMGNVTVARTTYQTGTDKRWYGLYTWTISFTDKLGDVDPLDPDTSGLSAAGISADATIEVTTVLDGNEVKGTFSVSIPDISQAASIDYSGLSGPAISAANFKAALYAAIDASGGTGRDDSLDYALDVTRSADHNNALGYTYTIEFLGRKFGGNLDMMTSVEK